MSKGKALACLTRDTQQQIKAQIEDLDSRTECRMWAQVEQQHANRTWVYEMLRKQAIEVDGEL